VSTDPAPPRPGSRGAPPRPGRRGALLHPGGDDAGGVWIATGIVLGVLMYGFIVLMDVAGFTAVAPLVVVPPVVLGLIAANSLLNGGRGYGRSARPAPAPLSSDDLDRSAGADGAAGSGGSGPEGRHGAGGSSPPR
jgi:hypothetical protein